MSDQPPTAPAPVVAPGTSDDWPTVSVVMPVRNEASDLEAAVTSVLAQSYPRPFDVCLAVAPSDDATDRVAAELARRHPGVTIVPNPVGTTPAGLNAAIAATEGDVVVRVDGHAELSPGYIRRAVDTLRRTGAANVGGRQVPVPRTPFEEVVAGVTSSWIGTGGATYRVGGGAGPVDTVYLGVFDRRSGDAVGWFDEGLIRNQDYELNIRLREAGGTVWFDPELEVGYRPRGTFRALGRQYFEYGWWKAEVVRRHPSSLRLRQAAPVFVTLAVGASVVGSVRWRRLLAMPAAYAALLATVRPAPRAPAVAATMHLAWGSGFVGRVLARTVEWVRT